MSKLPTISSSKLIRKLLKAGFEYAPIKGKGSHTALLRIDETGRRHITIIPHRDSIPKGTLMSIIKQSGLSHEEFISLIE